MGSLWGRSTSCDSCSFRFDSNHTHTVDAHFHPARGMFCAVCVACAREFLLPTAGPWGPSEGELLELFVRLPTERSRRQIKKNIGAVFSFQSAGVQALFELAWRVTRRIPDLGCPACGAPDSIAIDFADGDPCPACKRGSLHGEPSVG